MQSGRDGGDTHLCFGPAGRRVAFNQMTMSQSPGEVEVPEVEATEDRRARRRGNMFGAISGTAAAVFAVAFVGLTLWSPDGSVVLVELDGTDLAPEASARAVVNQTGAGTSIELDVADLEPAPEGAYYQAWMHGESGTVSIGSFHLRDGSDAISLWSGVDIGRYPVLMVTLQDEAAGSSPGPLVLVGRDD